MGIYDRDYYQEKPQGFTLGMPRMMVTNLVLINVAVYVLQLFTRDNFIEVNHYFGLNPAIAWKPWFWYQFLTYGFMHSVQDIWHLLFNMLTLWFLGRDVEEIYGKRKFLQFYLSTVVLSGLIWAVLEVLTIPYKDLIPVVGASGAVAGVVAVFVMHYPRRMVYLYFVIPVPIWIVAVGFLIWNAVGAASRYGEVAYSAHLAGAALGFLFYKTQWSLGSLWPEGWTGPLNRLSRPRNVRLHQPEEDDVAQMKAEVDRILEKITREGESSLTTRERRTLEEASRRYQQRGR